MSFGKEIAGAQDAGQYAYFLTGSYLVRVTGLRDKKPDGYKKVAAFVAEFEIVESSNPDRPAGMQVSWFQPKSKNGYAGRVKRFFKAIEPALETATETDFGEYVDIAVSPAQPCVGMLLRVQCAKHTTQDGTVIDACTFSPVPAAAAAKAG